jgi:hypothetical protein
MKNKLPGWFFTALAAVLMLLVSAAYLDAQGLSSLSQLFGGGGGQHRSNGSEQAGGGVMVQRSAVPFMGTFNGEQKSDSGTMTMNSHFACYPAHDPELAQTQAFVCYSAATTPQKSSEE